MTLGFRYLPAFKLELLNVAESTWSFPPRKMRRKRWHYPELLEKISLF